MTTATSERRDAAWRWAPLQRNFAFSAALLSAMLIVGCGHDGGPIELTERDAASFVAHPERDRKVAPQATVETSPTIAVSNEAPLAASTSVASPVRTRAGVAAAAAAATSTPTEPDADWYTPREADFRAIYDQDAANAKLQTFNDYYGWVKTFYEGSVVAEGWKSRVAKLVDRIRSDETKASLRTALNAFGRRVSGEWAKSGSARRIDTIDILEFGPRLEAAKAKDDGSGATLQAEIDFINRKIDERLK